MEKCKQAISLGLSVILLVVSVGQAAPFRQDTLNQPGVLATQNILPDLAYRKAIVQRLYPFLDEILYQAQKSEKSHLRVTLKSGFVVNVLRDDDPDFENVSPNFVSLEPTSHANKTYRIVILKSPANFQVPNMRTVGIVMAAVLAAIIVDHSTLFFSLPLIMGVLMGPEDDPFHEENKKSLASSIQGSFDAYWANYRAITKRAKKRFENQDWAGVVADDHERNRLYRQYIDQAAFRARGLLSNHALNRSAWLKVKEYYSYLYKYHYELDLAVTYFYSVMRRIFANNKQPIEYSDDGVKPRSAPRAAPPYYSYSTTNSLERNLELILKHPKFDSPFENLKRDITQISARLRADIKRHKLEGEIEAVEFLKPVFYRNKGAYIMGRLKIGDQYLPVALALLNRNSGIYVDAVLVDDGDISNLFSHTRLTFRVDSTAYRELTDFIRTLVPHRDRAAILTSIGFIHPAKLEFVKDLRRHLRRSGEKFEKPPGIQGMVMDVFALPSFPYVFKVPRDNSSKITFIGREDVIRQYQRVHETDRVGRKLDAIHARDFVIDKNFFPDELLEELLKNSPRNVVVEEDTVIFRDIFFQRKVIPLDVYFADPQVSSEDKEKAVIDFGYLLKDLSAAGLFIGDLLAKNFGIGSFGRVISYDNDDDTYLLDMNIRSFPKDKSIQDELIPMHKRITVMPGDFFPEELSTFLLARDQRDILKKYHPEIFTVEYWQGIQNQLKQGLVPDYYPYPQHLRFQNNVPPAAPSPRSGKINVGALLAWAASIPLIFVATLFQDETKVNNSRSMEKPPLVIDQEIRESRIFRRQA